MSALLSGLLALGLLSLGACGDKDSGGDSGPAGDDGGTTDGGTTDSGDGDDGGDGGDDSGGGDDGGTDSGGEPDCSTLRWRTEARVALTTQAELTPFCDEWNALDGDLTVDVSDPDDPITELDGIRCLCEVTGDLVITGDPEAPVPGPPPPHVTGDIELPVLERVGGDLTLTAHPNLTYVEGMRALTEVGGDIRVSGSPNMQVVAFYTLQTVGGTVQVTDQDKQLILRLPNATSIGGLQVGAPDDSATPYFLVELKLDDLVTVTGDLQVYGSRNLASLAAPLLTSVGDALRLDGACSAEPSFPRLTEVGSLVLRGQCGMADLDGFSALTRITGQDDAGDSLRLEANPGLDPGEIDAFVAGLEISGAGAVDVENAGDCADVLDAWGPGWCD